jgi:hypothetical protein
LDKGDADVDGHAHVAAAMPSSILEPLTEDAQDELEFIGVIRCA